MLSSNPVTASHTGRTLRRTQRRSLRSASHVRPNVASIVLAVVVLLLVSPDASANLAAEVPLSHWSYETLARLEATGILDTSKLASPIERPLTRFELASAARDALAFALAMTTGDALETLEPRRALVATTIAVEYRLEQASKLHEELFPLMGDQERLTRHPALPGVIERFAAELDEIEREAARTKEEAASMLQTVDEGDQGAIAFDGIEDGTLEHDALEVVLAQLRALKERLERALEGLFDGLLVQPGTEEAERIQRRMAPELTASVEKYLRFVKDETWGEQRLTDGEFSASRLAEDLRALAGEFAADMERLGSESRLRRFIQSLHSGEEAGFSIHSQEQPAQDRRRGVSLDAIIAAVEGDAGTRQRSLSVPVQSAVAAMDPRAAVAKAEYGFRVLGVDLFTSLSMDAGETGEPLAPTTRVQASLPFPGERGGLEAGYSFIDVDRLRELSSDPAARRRLSLSGLLEEDGRSRFHVAGEMPLGNAASIRVGYELRIPDESTSRGGRVLGAGLRYRLGEDVSLAASFSMIHFEGSKEAAKSGVGEAELVVRF